MERTIDALLASNDDRLDHAWSVLVTELTNRFGREGGIESMLFLIGIQSRGSGYEPRLPKEAKQDVVMEGTYCAFETLGLYRRVEGSESGKPSWRRVASLPPNLTIAEQEKLLRLAILAYFERIWPDLLPAV